MLYLHRGDRNVGRFRNEIFSNIFNWVDVPEEEKIKILKKCINEKIEVNDCDLYINNYLEHISKKVSKNLT